MFGKIGKNVPKLRKKIRVSCIFSIFQQIRAFFLQRSVSAICQQFETNLHRLDRFLFLLEFLYTIGAASKFLNIFFSRSVQIFIRGLKIQMYKEKILSGRKENLVL